MGNLTFPLNSWIDLITQAITDMAHLPYNLVQNAMVEKHTQIPIIAVTQRNNLSIPHNDIFITFHQANTMQEL